jgi:hypothetical protein
MIDLRRYARGLCAGAAAAAVLGLAPPTAKADVPAAGTDINGKTVFIIPLSWLRYGEGLVSRPYTFTRNALEVKGRGKCSDAACPVVVSGVEVFARRTRVDLAKPPVTAERPIATERTLRRGDEGEDVKRVQQALVKAGYKVEVDGKYGRGTMAAVREFQKKSGLNADGNFGPLTRAKLTV